MDLSIIVLSYNTKDITDECLSRLPKGAEVIAVDNASEDGSVEMVEKKYPWVKLIKSKANLGFAKGNNLAMKHSNSPVVLFLNSDCFVEKDTLNKALEYFKNNSCDMLGVKLTYEDGRLQPSAGELPDLLNTCAWIFGLTNSFHPKNKKFFAKAKQVGWVTGAFLMMRKEVFEKTGGFDEKIFMYMDEVDLCKRINMAGYKVCFTPDIAVTHLQRASQTDSTASFVRELAGIKYYFQKYYSIYPFLRLFLVLGLTFRIIAFSLLGKTRRAAAYVEALGVI